MRRPAASGRYPLTRFMYIRLKREPGEPLRLAVREFLRFVHRRESQKFIPVPAYYPRRTDEIAGGTGQVGLMARVGR